MLTRAILLETIDMFIQGSARTPKIRKLLHTRGIEFKKQDVSHLLYKLRDEGVLANDGGVPPAWWRIEDDEEEQGRTYVIVDCDNRQHCFKNAARYASKELRVVGFANPTYNFWFPDEKQDKYCKLFSVKESLKNSSRYQMCLFISDKCHKHDNPCTFIIVSGDKSVKTIATITSKRYDCTVIALNGDWEDLKLEIE